MAAAPAAATEGPSGPPLPNTLAPVTVPNTLPAPTLRRALHPRVLRVRLTRHLHHGKRGKLRLSLADSRSVKVVIERRVGKRKYRRARTISASPVGNSVSLKLRSLPVGHYRVTIVSTSDDGARSRPVRRQLISSRR
jgi:hypothetical protein